MINEARLLCAECKLSHTRRVVVDVPDMYCSDECRDGDKVRRSLSTDPAALNMRSATAIRRLIPFMEIAELTEVVRVSAEALADRKSDR